MAYAFRIRKNPQRSSMYDLDRDKIGPLDVGAEETLTLRHNLVLLTFLVTIAALVVGVINYGFYIDELSALFLMMGIAAGFIGGLSPRKIADGFMSGCHNMLLPCIMVGLCKSTTLLLTDAQIIDTIIHFLADILNRVPSSFTAFGMFVVQDLFNILVPSGSGQAAITMPIMAPLADMVGVSRQTAVLAFQMGDAFTNCVTPASGMTMSCLAMAGVPYGKWLKFVLPLLALWWVVAFVFLTYATTSGYGPFYGAAAKIQLAAGGAPGSPPDFAQQVPLAAAGRQTDGEIKSVSSRPMLCFKGSFSLFPMAARTHTYRPGPNRAGPVCVPCPRGPAALPLPSALNCPAGQASLVRMTASWARATVPWGTRTLSPASGSRPVRTVQPIPSRA